jgi:hypothetical protein
MKISVTLLDLDRSATKGHRAENNISFPSAGINDKGLWFYHTANELFYGWTGAGWVPFNGTGGIGGITGIESQQNSVQVVGSSQVFNFTGPSVTVTDQGGGITGIAIAAEQPSGFEEVTEGGNTGWRFIGEIAGDNINRYEIGSGAWDAMRYFGGPYADPYAPVKPYGTKSSGGINFGLDNKDNAQYNSFIAGGANQTTAYANAVMIGNYNRADYGYGDVLIGTYNRTNPTNVNSFLFAMGHNVEINTAFFGAGIGLALRNKAQGSVVVGRSNIPWAGSQSAANRPAFAVGIGTTTTPSARWEPLIQRDGFNVNFNGEVIANYLTVAVSNAEPTGRILVTREFGDSRYASGNAELLTLTPSVEPITPSEGMVYMDSTTHILRCYDGTIWQDLF